jgi:hypothetical protein
MRIVVFALLGLLSLTVNGQGGVVSAPVLEAQQKTQMGFEAEERAREAARHAAKMDELIAQTDLASKHVAVAKDRLQILKDGVEKLQKINAKINDIRALERALDRQVYMIERSRSFMEGVNARGTLSLKQTSDAIDIIQEIISSASYTVSMLAIVLKPGNTEMDDYGRLSLMKSFLDQLNQDVLLLETALYEIERVESSTRRSHTVQYMNDYFKTYTKAD